MPSAERCPPPCASNHIERRSSAAVWLSACLLGGMTVWISVAEQPATRIHGRTLEDWRELMGRLDLQDPASRGAVPGLIAVMESEAVPWFTRRQAALTLGRLGPHATEAVPVLIKLLDDDEGPAANSPRLWAIKALALFGPAARDAVPPLAKILDDSAAESVVRLSVIEALWRIGPAHPQTIPLLLRRVQSPVSTETERELQLAAVEALGAIGSPANAAVPALVRLLDHPDEHLRREAVTALGRMNTAAEITVEPLLNSLASDESPVVRDAAAAAVQQLPPSVAGEAVASLLSAEDPELRERSAQILGAWGKAARAWTEHLVPLWDDPSPTVRLAALQASWNMTGSAQGTALRTARLLTAEDRHVRRAALTLLEQMGRQAAEARPLLQALQSHARADVRTAAKKALQAMHADGDPSP
jgi:HEAT repeat protein